jgi:hypothetical protein
MQAEEEELKMPHLDFDCSHDFRPDIDIESALAMTLPENINLDAETLTP